MEEIQILRNMSHIGKGRGEADFLQIRIDTYYLRELQRGDAIKALRDSLVHRIRIPDAESISLLLFTPDPEHLQFATDLVQEFVDTCRAAISDYHNYLNGLARIDAGHAEPITDSSFRTLVPPSLPDTLQMDPYDVFVSYNSADRAFVDKVVTELERHNLNPWYDQRQLRVGESWLDAITQQINQVRSALVFIGTHGMGNWQEPEIKWMVLKLREKRRPVIPVIMPGATPANIPLFLREFSAVDYNTDRDATTRIIEAIRAASPPRRSRATRRRD
jgi:nucleotide-binding universal stress UspA family protein